MPPQKRCLYGVLLLSDANSIACLHLHVIGANRAIFSAFFCAIHYARREWRLFCCGETGDFTTGKTVGVVNYEATTANGYLFPDFRVHPSLCKKRRNITIEHILHGFVIRSQR